MMNQRKVGATLSYVSTFLQIIIGFVYIPLLLKLITQSDYGLFETMGSFIAYMAILDLGLANTLTRYYSRELEAGDKVKQENILAIGARIYGIIAAFTLLVGLALYFLIGPMYGSSFSQQELVTSKQMFLIMIFNTCITISANMFTSIIYSHEKFWVDKLLTISKTVLQPVVIILILMQVPNVLYIVVVQAAFNIGIVLFKIYYCRNRIRVRIRLHNWDKALVSEMARFSFYVFLNMITTIIYWKTDQLILGAVTGTTVVAVYAISARLNDYFRTFSSTIASVFLPRLSRLSYLSEDMTEINKIFFKIGRLQFLIVFLVLTGFIIFGKLFLRLWVGANYDDAYGYSLIIMIPLLIPLIQSVGISVLEAKNKHPFRSKLILAIAIVNVIASIPLAKAFGGIGCAAATGVALFIGQGVVLNIYYSRVIHLKIKAFFVEILKMATPLIFVGVAGYLAFEHLGQNNVMTLVVGVLLYLTVYGAVAYLFSMNEYEKGLLTGIIKKVASRRRK
jgi:O-antigen/teichoic acid export membrane protein